MTDLEIYKDKIKRATLLTVLTQEVYLYAEYFHRPNSTQELELYNKEGIGSHLRFIRHLLFRNLIVELFKLFSTSNNDKLNLLGIIKEANAFKQIPEINLFPERLIQFKDKINLEAEGINVIKNLRHKLYAHTDIINLEEFDFQISFDQLGTLVEIAKEVVKYLNVVFLNSDFLFRPVSFDRERFQLFNLIIKGENERIIEIQKKYGLDTQ